MISSSRSHLALVITLAWLSTASVALAQLPSQTVHVSGEIADPLGVPITVPIDLHLRVYDSMAAGMLLFEETHAAVPLDAQGRYHVELGSVMPMPPGLFAVSDLWISLEVDGDGEMIPRVPLSRVPGAFNADLLDGSPAATFAPRSDLNDQDPLTTPVHWADLLAVPPGFADGIDDVDDADADPTNELQDWTTLPAIPAGFADGIDDVDDADADPTNELQDWTTLPAIPAGFADGIDDVDDADADPTNELQDWTTLPAIPAGFADDVDDVDDADADPTNELQDWTTLPAIPAGFADDIDDVDDADSDPTNELQDWTTLPAIPPGFADGIDDVDDADADPANELQDWTTLPAIPAGFADGIDDVDDADADPANELQDWTTLPAIPAAFADGIDDVDDADADPTNELISSAVLMGTDLQIGDAGGINIVDLSGLVGGPPTGPAGGSLVGTYPNPSLGSDTVDNRHVVDGSLIAADLAPGSVTTSQILNGTILAADLAPGSVTTSQILNGTILAADLAPGSVTTSQILNGTILAVDLAPGSVTGAAIAPDAVTTAEIADGTILPSDLAFAVPSPVWQPSGTSIYNLNSGNVGVGTAAPLSKLQVVGGVDASLATHGHAVLGSISSSNLVLDDNEIMARNNGAAAAMMIQNDGGDLALCAAGGTVTMSGEVVRPAMDVSFRVFSSSGVGIATATDVPVIFNVIGHLHGANYDPSTGTFTAPADGVYLFTTLVLLESASLGANCLTRLEVNGATAVLLALNPAPTAGIWSLGGSTIMPLGAGDQVRVTQNVGGGSPLIGSTSAFSGCRLY